MGERGDRRVFGPASKSTLLLLLVVVVVVVVVAEGADVAEDIPKSISRMSTEDVSKRLPLPAAAMGETQKKGEGYEGGQVKEVGV